MRTTLRWLLAAGMVFAGLSHLFWGRREFQNQVPEWATEISKIDKDGIVMVSGAVEVMLGAALVVLPKEKRRIGAILAGFFIAIFPGNVDQWLHHRNGFGMDSDAKRLGRLFIQPLLVAGALWSTRR
ncbi:DoxX family protein [Microbacterium sp. F51-2R]|jgi:uncharacterized membrane protein|uniref:DoxX family protein n=1 Tax=Microbacterium sp. F51-2R TaxID=3445777 RepID=UPI003FA11F70